MVLFAVKGLAFGLESATKMLFLTSWLEIHVIGQHRYIKNERYKWHRTCAVVTKDERHPPLMPQNPLTM